jgi:2-succinyl-5-enolpyruvyl-6-hydroxy-3-cyclohexene-1-carboxylate synthase
LGISKAERKPAVLVTTSGSAVANLYPAIIEAYNSRIPLIILTADRPGYLANTGANQTINQIDIFKNHIRKFYNLNLPDLTKRSINSLKKIAVDAYLTAVKTDVGPVHINFPFEKPFEPSAFTDEISNSSLSEFIKPIEPHGISSKKIKLGNTVADIKKSKRGIIILGGSNYQKDFFTKLIKLSAKLKFPILAEGNSSIRFYKSESDLIIANHTAFLRSDEIRNELDPDLILHFGSAPATNTMLQFIESSKSKKIFMNKFDDLNDPSRTADKLIRSDESEFVKVIYDNTSINKASGFSEKYSTLDKIVENEKEKYFQESKIKIEPNLIKIITELLPQDSNLFISNSMPVRDFDFFASKNNRNISIYTNRGASGIDGIISTAAGIAQSSTKETYLIIGDLAFYHDTNGLQILTQNKIPLKIFLINNGGGRIFNLLPIANEKINFDKYFRTELKIDFKSLVKGHKGNYNLIKSFTELKSFINSKSKSYSVAELITDTETSIKFRKTFWNKSVEECKKYLFQ